MENFQKCLNFRLQKYGIPCPKFLCLKKHVLMMSFIGRNQVAAPKLKEASMKTADYELAFHQVKEVRDARYM